MKNKKTLNDFLVWLNYYGLLDTYFKIVTCGVFPHDILRNLNANDPDTLFDFIFKNSTWRLASDDVFRIDWEYIKVLYTNWLLNIE